MVSADDVVRYLSEHQLGEAELSALLSNTALVPGHERMFVEARWLGYGMLANAHTFGWTVQREDDGHGGWLMTTGLILEWHKGVPIGPIVEGPAVPAGHVRGTELGGGVSFACFMATLVG